MPERGDFTPFKDEFDPNRVNEQNSQGGFSNIYRFKEGSDRLVRSLTLDIGPLPPRLPVEEESRFIAEAAAQRIRETKASLETLSKYIPVPKHEFLLGDKKDARGFHTIYTVTDKVDGESLDLALTDKDLSNQELEDFYNQLLSYYQEVFSQGGDFLWDLASHKQYMFGTTDQDPQKKIYLVDIESNIDKTRRYGVLSQRAKVSLSGVSMMIDQASRARGYDFSQARQRLWSLENQFESKAA